MTPEIASFLLELLGQAAYNGTPDELRALLARHDQAVFELTAIVEAG